MLNSYAYSSIAAHWGVRSATDTVCLGAFAEQYLFSPNVKTYCVNGLGTSDPSPVSFSEAGETQI